MGLERSGSQVCVACRGALFHYGMGGAVEKRMVSLAGLLTSAVRFILFYFEVKHRPFMLSPFCRSPNDNPTNPYCYLFLHHTSKSISTAHHQPFLL